MPIPRARPTGSSATPRTRPGGTSRSISRMATPPDDQCDCHHHRLAEQRLDLLVQSRADDRRRQERDQHVANERPRPRLAAQSSRRDGQERPPVGDDHRQDRTQLDDDVEHLPSIRIVAEQRGSEDQVPGRRDRQKFGQPLDDAEDDRRRQLAGGDHTAGLSPETAMLAETHEPLRRDRLERSRDDAECGEPIRPGTDHRRRGRASPTDPS